MTNEERAAHIAQEFGATKSNKERAIYRACIRMATEQKAIDDKEKEELIDLASKRIADVEASRSRLLQRRESIINKVIKKSCGWLQEHFFICHDYYIGDTIVTESFETIEEMCERFCEDIKEYEND